MLSLIIIGICIVTLVIHITIGHLSAIKLAPKVAEISIKPSNGDGITEYEWGNNFPRDSSNYATVWFAKSWQPRDIGNWNKTGRKRTLQPDDSKFNEDIFKSRMILIRQLWFVGVPLTFSNLVDMKAIEKYDPSVAERKAKQQDARIKELEKELSIGD